MSQIGVFTPEQARALWQDYLSRQQLRPQVSQNYPLRRQPDEVSPHRVFIRNDSGETLPAYGCAQVTGTTTVGGVTVVTVDKPSSTSAEYLFCSRFEIEDGATGWAYRYGVVVMLGDAPSSAGAQYGPIVDSWEIEEKSGPFVVFGAGADAGTLVGRVGSQPQDTTTPGSGGPCDCGTIYARGSVSTESYGEHATTYTITAPCDADWPFPEVTHDTGENWTSPEEDLCTCYGSSVPGQLTLTPCGSTTVCGVTRYHAKITLASTAGETRCDYETAEQPAAVWYIDDWHPLGPTSEAVLVSSTVVPNSLSCWEPPGKLCVAPKRSTQIYSCNEHIDILLPDPFIADLGAVVIANTGDCTCAAALQASVDPLLGTVELSTAGLDSLSAPVCGVYRQCGGVDLDIYSADSACMQPVQLRVAFSLEVYHLDSSLVEVLSPARPANVKVCVEVSRAVWWKGSSAGGSQVEYEVTLAMPPSGKLIVDLSDMMVQQSANTTFSDTCVTGSMQLAWSGLAMGVV